MTLRRLGLRIEARERLRHGIELAESCGAVALARRGHEELLAAGARPRRRALRGPGSLTPGERRVVELAARSLTNREIADALFVTRKAVRFHLGNAYKKLEVSGRDQLARALEERR
jgi:DNA-binding CsgD family transcriptional regulator